MEKTATVKMDFLMPQFLTLPEEVAAVFGDAAPKFVDFLISTFSLQKEEVAHMSALTFENKLEKATGVIRLEIAELRAEMKADFADVQKQISGLHKDITSQTKWILAGLATAVTMYPILARLVDRLI